MIYLYSGTPGSGKSLHAANDVRFALNLPSPRPVLGNFDIAADAPVKSREDYHYWANEDLSVDKLVDFAENYWAEHPFREEHILLVIDECQLLFNSRNWSSKDRLEWIGFLSQHRKYGYKVILVAQSAKMVDNQFRMLVDIEVNHRKARNMGAVGWLLSLPFGGNLFCEVTYLFQEHERLGSSWTRAKVKDMAMYDTHKAFVGRSDT